MLLCLHVSFRATSAFKMYHIQLPEFRKKYKSFESVKGEPFLTWLYLLKKSVNPGLCNHGTLTRPSSSACDDQNR